MAEVKTYRLDEARERPTRLPTLLDVSASAPGPRARSLLDELVCAAEESEWACLGRVPWLLEVDEHLRDLLHRQIGSLLAFEKAVFFVYSHPPVKDILNTSF
jgi:hypothetical protein